MYQVLVRRCSNLLSPLLPVETDNGTAILENGFPAFKNVEHTPTI